MPFVIIIDTGKSKKRISEPSFNGKKAKNSSVIIKLAISKFQLLLKVLLTPMISTDLKKIDNKEIENRHTKNQKSFVCV